MTDKDEVASLLVTGGAGFIGSNFVRYLARVNPQAKVVVLDKMTYAANPHNLDGLSRKPIVIRGDICDSSLVEQIVKQHHINGIIHFAAESHNDNSIRDAAPFIHTNIYGTYVLLEAARRHDLRFHHVSTDEVFGDTSVGDVTKFDESSPYRPSSPYSATKAASDHLVRAWWRTYGTRVTITNSSNNYGPFQHVEKFIPRQITNILTGHRPKLYGQGKDVRDWLSVEDDCRAIWDVYRRGRLGQTYLVGADNRLSNLAVVQMILAMMNRPLDEVEFVRDRPGADRRYAIDASKIRRELGWKPLQADFAKSLEATIEWYKRHESWWMPAKQTTELRYRQEGH